jgi:flagellar motor switch protein FliN
MTDALAQEAGSGDAMRAFLQTWAESLSQVLGQISGSTVPCEVLAEAPGDLPSAVETDIWAVITCSGGLRGEMSLRLASGSALRLAQVFVGETPSETTASANEPGFASPSSDAVAAKLSDEQREAVIELLRQVAGVSSSAKERWGEVQLHIEVAPSAPSWPAAATFWLKAGESSSRILLEAGISAALAAELKAEKVEAAKPVAYPSASPTTAAATADAAKPGAAVSAGDAAQDAGALDALMDVQLSMTLRFGSKTLLLREVLDLSPGAVVELDRKVAEPVDLLLEGKVVARGDLVVIDGNYGLRVTYVLLGNVAAQQ